MTRALARRGVAGWRAAALAGTLLAMLAGYLTATVISASAADPLLSQGRPATASSTENAGTPAPPRGRRQHRHPLVQRVQRPAVDPGRPGRHRHRSARSSCAGRRAYATAFQIQTSANGTDLDDRLHHHHRHRRRRRPRRHRLRPLRADERHRPRHRLRLSLWEFQVYGGIGGGGGCGTANAAQGRPGHRVLRPERPAFPATAAVDGNPGTRWSSASSRPAVDPGRPRRARQAICGVTLNWEAAYATRLPDPGLAPTAPAWTTIYTTTTGTGGTQTLTVTGTGRYVRMYGTARATAVRLLAVGVRRCAPAAAPTTAARRRDARRRARPPTARRPGGDVLLSYNKPACRLDVSQNDGSCCECIAGPGVRPRPGQPLGDQRHHRLGRPGLDLRRPRRHRRRSRGSCCSGTRRTPPRTRSRSRPTRPPGRPSTPPPPAPASRRPSPSTAPAATCGCTAPRGPTPTATRSGSSRSTAPAATRPRRRRMPPDPTFPATRLVWSDEFNGAAGSKPDPAKWTIDPGTGQNNEMQYYTNNNNANMDGAGSLVHRGPPGDRRRPRLHLAPDEHRQQVHTSSTAGSRPGSRCPRATASGRRSG